MRKLIDSHGGLLRLLSSVLSLPWTGATWAVDGNGRAYNTPTLGSELLTNGNMETGSPPSSWGATGVTATSDADAHAGTQALKLVAIDGSADRSEQNTTLAIGNWLFFDTYAKRGAQGIRQSVIVGNTTIPEVSILTSNYQRYVGSGRASAANPIVRLYVAVTSGAAGDIVFYDDVSLKPISLPTAVATVAGGSNAQIATAKINAITTGTQAGTLALVDSASNPQNFIIAYHNGTSAIMDKCVGGTYTNLVTATVSFVSDAAIEIRPLGSNQFDCYYNGSKQGNTATVSDAGIASNTIYGLFSTYSGNTFSEFTLGGAVVALTLPGA